MAKVKELKDIDIAKSKVRSVISGILPLLEYIQIRRIPKIPLISAVANPNA